MKNEFQNKLIYRSWHRGTKELDLILGNFISENIQNLSDDEIENYEILLNCEDPDIYKWIVNQEEPFKTSLKDLIGKIRAYLKSNKIDVLN
ncbi:MAG: succinate dehydrogenase assembly factor 2 [Alphaproteobacteria bacterium]|jgi:antitoxin CptB|tara:strand:+ start:2036 stop:2308 length:273 start_codon:yes stop_codon:yes gene_type:complete